MTVHVILNHVNIYIQNMSKVLLGDGIVGVASMIGKRKDMNKTILMYRVMKYYKCVDMDKSDIVIQCLRFCAHRRKIVVSEK
ncbi:Hypothetical predicted protein [Octopus vulgaris]|uniref:Uncharacterized protein n=1 Tax=Octopus vulgaris TaxID=6645 RepID=A0AA36EZF0_OCTVU|nr:Hypothetical predicted protein [Octopus vulgaris]